MKTASPALLAHLADDVRTVATCWLITRQDGGVFGYTDHDADILFNGQTFKSAIGYTASAIDSTSNLATSNMEMNALLDHSDILEPDIEGGLWDNAAVLVFMVNFKDLSMGSITLNSGITGQFSINEGCFTAEVRSLSQVMQQGLGEVYSSGCRANLGDARCKIDLGPLTANSVVTSVVDGMNFGAASLTQVGPTVKYTDSTGQYIPRITPFTIKVQPPTGGAFVSDVNVLDSFGHFWTKVTSSPGAQEYTVDGTGLYTFDGDSNGNSGWEVFINYNYSIGYFAYGFVKFTSGQNAGYKGEVRSFAPGQVSLGLPLPFPIAVGDAFTIVAGCDRSLGTCIGRFNNIVNFRGEPYVPGTDTIYKSQVVVTSS